MPSSTTYAGWGTGPWGRNGWGSPQNLISVDGVSSIGSVGSVLTAAGKFTNVSGVTTTGNVGSVAIQSSFKQNVTGVNGSGNIGAADLPLIVSGFLANGKVGSVLVWGVVNTDQTPNWRLIKEAA